MYYSVLSSIAIYTGRQVFQTGFQKYRTWKYHVRALFLAGEREWLSERTEWISPHTLLLNTHYFDKEVKVLDYFTFSFFAMTTYVWILNRNGGA